MDENGRKYIKQSISNNISLEQIRNEMIRNGYEEWDIQNELNSAYATPTAATSPAASAESSGSVMPPSSENQENQQTATLNEQITPKKSNKILISIIIIMAASVILVVFAIGLFSGDSKDQGNVSSGENDTGIASLNNTETGLLGNINEKIDNLIVTESEFKEMEEECAQKFRAYKEGFEEMLDINTQKYNAGEDISTSNLSDYTNITLYDVIQCYVNYSIISNNYSACENIDNAYGSDYISDGHEEAIKGYCYLSLASSTGDEKVCKGLKIHYDSCYALISEYHSDSSYCKKIKNQGLKEECLFNAVNKDNYKEICYSLTYGITVVKCIAKIAKETDNLEICDELQNYKIVGIESELDSDCRKLAS